MTTFERIDRSRDVILRNLYEHYVHDMSEWLGIDTRDDGAFGFDTNSLWQGDYAIYLARVGGSLAGFAVVGPSERWLGRSDGRDMKDFLVLRRFRHHGIGRAFATHLWNQHSGEWLIRVLVTNTPGLSFWRRAVRDYMPGRFAETCVLEHGNDSVARDWVHFRFDSREHPSSAVTL
jgi:predicted acetyltransferase